MGKFFLACFSIFSLVTVLSESARAQSPYCAAVRGNGELMPAHWGALAQMMETYGAPVGMAGGSSASITTFLWESANLNPLLAGNSAPTDSFRKGQELALLFKSLEGLTTHLYKKPRWNALAQWIQLANRPEQLKTLLANVPAGAERVQEIGPEALRALNDLRASGIFFGPAVRGIYLLINAPDLKSNDRKQTELAKRINALKNTLKVFGRFDAKSDGQLFVRDGIVDFTALARQFGALGDFLSLRSADATATDSMRALIETCLPGSTGRTWSELTNLEPRCQELLGRAIDSYFASYDFQGPSRVHEKVGSAARVLISTAIVKGESANRFRQIRRSYEKTLDSTLGADVTTASEDLKFGYWGRSEDLARIDLKFRTSNDPLSKLDKSERFLPLAPATWL